MLVFVRGTSEKRTTVVKYVASSTSQCEAMDELSISFDIIG